MKEQIEYIAVDNITPNPFQPRETFNKEKIEELAESIKKEGKILIIGYLAVFVLFE
jgi:ParB family transcriptional regulator, chromosome partitioning protein